jgi:nickel-dependent lactate racemase
VHDAACELCRERYAVPIEGRRRLVVAAAGGAPRDRDLVQAHKAMEHAQLALEEGGVMLLAAELPEGPGTRDVAVWLELGSPEAIREELQAEGAAGAAVYAQSALLFLEKTRRFHVLLRSEMSGEEAGRLGCEPVASLEEGLKRADEILGGAEEGYILPRGATVLPSP